MKALEYLAELHNDDKMASHKSVIQRVHRAINTDAVLGTGDQQETVRLAIWEIANAPKDEWFMLAVSLACYINTCK